MEMLIGREPDTNYLGLLIDGKHKVNSACKLPNSVSRLRIDERTAHCRIFIKDSSGEMNITNLNPQNVTFVNGEEIDGKTNISQHSFIALGADQYRLDLNSILKSIGFERPTSIKHLKRVWEKYDRELLNLQLEQQKNANRQRIQSLLSQVSMLCVIIPSVLPSIPIPPIMRVILVVAALGVGIYFFVRGNKTDNTFVMKKRVLDEDFREKYVCPKCGAFLGFTPYDTFEFRNKCSYCNAKFST